MTDAEFADVLSPLLGRPRPPRVAVAVSGGSDSMALMVLVARFAAAEGLAAVALTVDHQLRPEAAAEAAFVADAARGLGIDHHVLPWEGPKPAANLQAAARRARYGLMAAWRRRAGVGPLLLAHTEDDLAETFLLRLARGSGVDGLAAMAAEAVEDAEAEPPLRRLRPLLSMSRARLRATLGAASLGWREDPSNADLRFDRVKARQALGLLAPLGLGAGRLAKTAQAMSRARTVLERETDLLLAAAALEDADLGGVRLDRDRLAEAQREIALRAFARAIEWTAGRVEPPRLDGLERALDAALDGAPARTIAGVLIEPGETTVSLWREEAALDPPRPLAEGAPRDWDGRYRVTAARPGLRVGPLGGGGAAAIAARTDLKPPSRFWAAAPASARRAACAVFHGDTPLCCPAAGLRLHDVSVTPLRRRPASRSLGEAGAEDAPEGGDLT